MSEFIVGAGTDHNTDVLKELFSAKKGSGHAAASSNDQGQCHPLLWQSCTDSKNRGQGMENERHAQPSGSPSDGDGPLQRGQCAHCGAQCARCCRRADSPQ